MKRTVFITGLLLAATGHAAAPGDACTTSGQVMMTGLYKLVCNGSTWQQAEQINTSGQKNITIGNDTSTCNISKAGALRYNGSMQYCNGSAWTNMNGGESSNTVTLIAKRDNESSYNINNGPWTITGLTPYKPVIFGVEGNGYDGYVLFRVSSGTTVGSGTSGGNYFRLSGHGDGTYNSAPSTILIPTDTSITLEFANNRIGTLYVYQ